MDTFIGKDIEQAASILNQGGILGMPTETVYGLAGNALNEDAVLSIFKTKDRPFFDPLIVHTHSIAEISKYVKVIPDRLLPLMERFMPGPFTVLLPRKDAVPDLVTSGLERAAFRIPDHPMALALLRSIDFPLAAPSANPFGYISPTSAQHVLAQLGGKIPYILDGGDCKVGIESTIVGMEGDTLMVYRLGGLAVEEIEAVAGKVNLIAPNDKLAAAPGMLLSHYAPRKPFVVGDIDQLIEEYKGEKVAVLSFHKKYNTEFSRVLSPKGSTDEAAKRLFAAMRELDESGASLIIAEAAPDEGLGRAINDRLRRAAAKS